MKQTTVDRFWAKVDKNGPNGCWLWTANKTGGYGRFYPNNSKVLAHRYSYELGYGLIPDGHDIDHICNNRSCVNPDHLRACTRSENCMNALIRDINLSGFKGVCWDKGRSVWRSQIMAGGKVLHLGYFTTPNSAHIAYRNAARTYFGEFANFGDSR